MIYTTSHHLQQKAIYYHTINKHIHLTECNTYLLHGVLLEKSTSFQSVKKFTAFYGTRRFITACPYPEPDKSSPYHHIPLPEDPIYNWVSQVIPFPQVSPPKPCTHLSSHPYALHAPPISFCSILSPEQYWVEYRSLSSSLCIFLHSSYLISLGPKYSQYPQPTSLPHCKQSSCKPIKNNRLNYSSVYLDL